MFFLKLNSLNFTIKLQCNLFYQEVFIIIISIGCYIQRFDLIYLIVKTNMVLF